MKFLILTLALLLSSCAQMPTPVEKSPEVAVDTMKPVEVKPSQPTLPEHPKPLPDQKPEIAIIIKELKWFSAIPGSDARFRKIAANTQKVINSKKFEDRIRGHKYEGKSQFVDTTDTPDQVYEKIMSKDWVLEYRLEKLRLGSSTIGYTYPSVSWIAFNSRKWHVLSDADISANICHEYGGHKFGRYSHSMKWNKARPYSTPYGIGTACSEVYEEMFHE